MIDAKAAILIALAAAVLAVAPADHDRPQQQKQAAEAPRTEPAVDRTAVWIAAISSAGLVLTGLGGEYLRRRLKRGHNDRDN